MATTVQDVRGIIETTIADVYVSSALAMAVTFLRDHLPTTTLETDTLAHLEKLIAAHFLCIYRPRSQEKEMGPGAKEVARGRTNLYLEASLYGQQAVLMDPTGLLAIIAKKGGTVVCIGYLGNDVSAELE